MNFKKNQPFWTSVILHLIVLVSLFLGTIVQAFKPKEQLHVFEMVSPPSDNNSEPTSQPVDPLPRPEDIPEVEPLEIPDIQIPKPQPAPLRQPDPKPAPPKPEIVRYEDFIKENPKTPKTQTQAPKPRIERDIQIDVPKVSNIPTPTINNPNPAPLTQSELNQLATYNARLRSRLDAAWSKPASLGASQLYTTVIFEVSPSGQISNVRLSPSSGNAAFDQSVQAAFARVGNAGSTPTGQGHTFTMTFRMAD